MSVVEKGLILFAWEFMDRRKCAGEGRMNDITLFASVNRGALSLWIETVTNSQRRDPLTTEWSIPCYATVDPNLLDRWAREQTWDIGWMTYANVDQSSRLEPRDLVDPRNSSVCFGTRHFSFRYEKWWSRQIFIRVLAISEVKLKVERSICWYCRSKCSLWSEACWYGWIVSK